MSDEGRVMPSDVVQEITPEQVTPVMGEGALGLDGHLRNQLG